jgi:putative transposase
VRKYWSRSSAVTNAATARASCRSLCAVRTNTLVGSACAGPCVAEACTRCNPRPSTPRTTDSTHGLRCAPNRLLDQPKPTQANQVWISDITYLPLANGDWAYLCAYQDMVSKQVVGWHVMVTMPEKLITTALQRAFWAQPPTTGLLVHSDRGGQCCGKVYRKLLHDHEALRSQSRRGDCYDNAQAESL